MLVLGDGGCVVLVSAGHEYVDVTRGSCIVSSAADVLGMRGGGGMCMCLARGGVVVSELGLSFTNPVGTGEVFDVCLCCGGVSGGLGQGLEGWRCYDCDL